MSGAILVIGATGTVGSEVMANLAQRGERVRAATRSPRPLAGGGESVEFDFDRPETFAPALAGAERVFLIARPGDEHPDRVARPLIDEMKRRGVRHVVNLTAMGVESVNTIALRQVELYLEDSGIPFTHLRPNWFMQVFSAGPLLAGIRAAGEIRIPAGDARISYIDARDIAGVAVVALTASGHAGRGYTLTGDRALGHDEIAWEISDASGKAVRYVPIGEDEARSTIGAAGLSAQRVERLLSFYRLVRDGYGATVTEDVRAILGRPAITFTRFACDHASAWS